MVMQYASSLALETNTGHRLLCYNIQIQIEIQVLIETPFITTTMQLRSRFLQPLQVL